MARQHYYLEDGREVPGVTTVLRVLDKPSLLKWAWQCGIDGKDFRELRDGAADVGTFVHAHIAASFGSKNELPDGRAILKSPEKRLQAIRAWRSFKRWKSQHIIEPIAVEVPRVNFLYEYGGTIDLYALVDAIETLVDIKTSNGIWPEMEYQVAAYCHLPDVFARRVLIVRFGKDGSFEEREVDNITQKFKVFEHCLEIYNLRNKLGIGN